MLGGGKAETMFEKGYREIVSLPSALDAYHRFFSDLAEEQHRPALFHCTTGKDRTGWAAAFDEMRKKFGSFEGYFTEGLRIDAATQQRLRAAFTEGGAA
jgi:protein tyrosine/serine phosphatase